MGSRGPQHSAGHARLRGRARALVAIGAVLGVVGGVCTVSMVVAEPQYVSVCGADECASVSVSPKASKDPAVAVVSIGDRGAITLANHNAAGRAVLGVLGYFDSENPARQATNYLPAQDGLHLSVELSSNEKRSIRLTDAPKTARTVLVRLGGPADAAADASFWRSTAYQYCLTKVKHKETCRYASVNVRAHGTVTADQVRAAIRKHAETRSTPSTPVPSVDPGKNPVVDDVVDQVTDSNGNAETPPTPEEPAPVESAPPAAPSTPEASSPPSTPAPEPSPPATESPAPEAPPVPTPTPTTTPDPSPSAGAAGWKEVWGDEFNDGSIDTSTWTVLDNSTYGDGNLELECLLSGNVKETGGALVITARKLPAPAACGSRDSRFPGGRSYTSGFIETKNKLSFTYGRYEIRFKSPTGPGTSKGLWPAFWLRPADGGRGELDAFEIIGTNAADAAKSNLISHTLHYDYNGTYPNQGRAYPAPFGRFDTDFHTLAIEWEPGAIRWYVDGVLSYERTRATTPWLDDAFGRDFYLKLNMAVGGRWPGSPDADTQFPADYVIDYVRVYQR